MMNGSVPAIASMPFARRLGRYEGGRLMAADGRVAPVQVQDRQILGIPRARVQRLRAQAEVVHEVQLAPAVAGRLDGLVVPLQEALRVRVRAVLLGVRGAGEEEH